MLADMIATVCDESIDRPPPDDHEYFVVAALAAFLAGLALTL